MTYFSIQVDSHAPPEVIRPTPLTIPSITTRSNQPHAKPSRFDGSTTSASYSSSTQYLFKSSVYAPRKRTAHKGANSGLRTYIVYAVHHPASATRTDAAISAKSTAPKPRWASAPSPAITGARNSFSQPCSGGKPKSNQPKSDKPARIINGTVMTAGDSWTWCATSGAMRVVPVNVR